MMEMNESEKISYTIDLSKKVIKDCCVENGAIIAANTDKGYYPKDASSYRYVWPRDASFVCVASDVLNIKIQEDFFQWCLERAEDFDRKGVFYQNYHTNGVKAGYQFQPDQTGSVLWAIWHHYRDRLEDALEFGELIKKGANGICRVWNGKNFSIPTYDIWEERCTFPDLGDNHTYSLAACAMGLRYANEIIENKKWIGIADEMERQIKEAYRGYFIRTSGKIYDTSIDSSLLGLLYPFNISSISKHGDVTDGITDRMIINTINVIEKRVVKNGGVYRYESDRYDGWVFNGNVRFKGAGAWPVLNFWMSICCSIIGDEKKGRRYYRWVLDKTNGYLPEQIFENRLQKSVSPLVWSHAMFIIASKFLGYL